MNAVYRRFTRARCDANRRRYPSVVRMPLWYSSRSTCCQSAVYGRSGAFLSSASRSSRQVAIKVSERPVHRRRASRQGVHVGFASPNHFLEYARRLLEDRILNLVVVRTASRAVPKVRPATAKRVIVARLVASSRVAVVARGRVRVWLRIEGAHLDGGSQAPSTAPLGPIRPSCSRCRRRTRPTR